MKETDLFEPVRHYFHTQGYHVAAEVKHCDVIALKGDELIVIELKTSMNMTLITQAIKRQRITNSVYVAIPEPSKKTKRFREQTAVLKRLGLGLITVYQSPIRSVASVLLEPSYSGRVNKRKRTLIEKEVGGRTIQPNVGGTKGKVYTAYRETAVTIACLINKRGPSRAAELAPITGTNTHAILYRNHYGWFVREGRGVYSLTSEGVRALEDYPDLVELVGQSDSPST